MSKHLHAAWRLRLAHTLRSDQESERDRESRLLIVASPAPLSSGLAVGRLGVSPVEGCGAWHGLVCMAWLGQESHPQAQSLPHNRLV